MQADIQRLGADGLAVHLRNSLGRLLGRAEVHIAESLGNILLLVNGNDGRGDLAAGGEHLAQLLVVDIVVKVLHVQVGALERSLVVGNTRLGATLLLVLTDKNLLAGDGKGLGVVELLNHFDSRFGSLEVDITVSLGLAAFTGNHGRSDLAADGKCSLELLVSHVLPEVLHIHVGEGLASVPLLVGNVVGDDQGKELGRSQLLAVGGFHGAFSLLAGLVLNEAKALGLAAIAASDFARQNVAKLGESVQEINRRDGGLNVPDDDISVSRLAHEGIALLPHNAKGPALDHRVVEPIESALGILSA